MEADRGALASGLTLGFGFGLDSELIACCNSGSLVFEGGEDLQWRLLVLDVWVLHLHPTLSLGCPSICRHGVKHHRRLFSVRRGAFDCHL